ncbi:MAG: hypothetical protein WA728_06365 [Xanthobacteraceae bacterium]
MDARIDEGEPVAIGDAVIAQRARHVFDMNQTESCEQADRRLYPVAIELRIF